MKAGTGVVGRRGFWVLGISLLMASAGAADQVRTDAGIVEGTVGADSHVRIFRGIPYAAPPVGEGRWQPPRPAPSWERIRPAIDFGPRCMQGRIFDDMVFRDEPSEDCLYLNVWTPAQSPAERLPVMVWIYGGGFQAGSASEPRQDGERLADKGVVVVGMNYRLGVFGFFSHPELTRESLRGASGNYGLMDQTAALRWVRDNIARFGGDPENVTIFGESAGSFSVSAQMASPLARGLVHRAIGESGAFLGRGPATPLDTAALSDAEKEGTEFAASIGVGSLAALRAMPADDLLKAALDRKRGFRPNIDGYFLPRDAYEIYAAGEQSHVPLLAGWNADEIRAAVTLAPQKTTAESFAEQTRKRFGDVADAVLKVYPARTDAEAVEAAAALASDLFIGYSTWKWIEVHEKTGQSPVYRYSFDRKVPIPPGRKAGEREITAEDIGARHAGEIEYVFGALDSLPDVPWRPADRDLSGLMMAYWSNFARNGDPNGPGLPPWPRYEGGPDGQVMHLDVTSGAATDATWARYEALDALARPESSSPPTPTVDGGE